MNKSERKYDLCNLDLGPNPDVREFKVGSYEIALIDQYDTIVRELSSYEKKETSFKVESGIIEVSENVTNKQLENRTVTALAAVKNESGALLSSEDSTPGIWDLCLILSYLTGRRVYAKEDEFRYSGLKYSEGAVEQMVIPKAAQIAWKNRDKIVEIGIQRPLWLYVASNGIVEAEIKGMLGCICLESIQNIVYKQVDPGNRIEFDPNLKQLIKDLQSTVGGSDIDDKLKEKLKSAIGCWGPKNPQQKFKQLLTTLGLIEDNINGVPLERVNGIFTIRNSLAHDGIIPHPAWIDSTIGDVGRKVAIFIIGVLIPSIIEVQLNQVFGLTHLPGAQWPTQNIKEYIYTGIWRGENIG